MKRGNRTNATTSAVSGSPLVSIIMPAYNVEKYIGDSIRSALAQSHRNIELIIVDDGSRDRTARVCQTWCRRDRRVRLIRARNGGVARARNIGIRSAKGEWIAFMDSDDLWKARKLERQLRAAREMGADVVYTGAWMFWNDRPERPEVPLGIRAGRFTSEAMLNVLLGGSHFLPSTVLMSREIIRRTGLFKEKGWIAREVEDWEFFIRMADRGGGVFFGLEDCLVLYRVRPGSTSSSHEPHHWGMLKLLDIYREHPKAKKVVIKASYMQTCRRIVAFQYGNRAFNQLGKIFEAVRSHYPGEQKRFLEFINQIL